MTGIAIALHRALANCLRGECAERRFVRRFPDRTVAANQRQSCVPRPYRNGKIKRADDERRAERMPRFHHAMLGALGGNGQAIELAR